MRKSELTREKQRLLWEVDFKYKLRGKLIDMLNGIVEVKGFKLHIDEDKIPKDMSNGMCIQFEASRIDIW